MDKRFILLVSVGLIVLAPKPVAWLPGIMDMRLPDEGVPAFPVRRGDLGVKLEWRFCSGVKFDPPSKFV